MVAPTKSNSPEDLKVFISNRESTCGECKENLGPHAWISLNRDKGALCLACADLEHLIFLSAGDAALTRRAKKHSTLSAMKGYERWEARDLVREMIEKKMDEWEK